jgi:hypothetical protein
MNSRLPKILASILMIVLIVVVIGFAYYLFTAANRAMDTVNSVLDPLQRTNNELSTKVAGLLHPTPTIIPDPVTIIDQVRAVARLETIHYTVEKVITAEINQGLFEPLFGDKLLFVAHGYVIAGVDLGKMNAEDMWLAGEILHVRLPPTEVLVATLDNQKSYVYNRETGVLTHGDMNLETAARQAAEEQIRLAALDDGILEQAQINANVFLEGFFESLGYQAVVFEEPKP